MVRQVVKDLWTSLGHHKVAPLDGELRPGWHLLGCNVAEKQYLLLLVQDVLEVRQPRALERRQQVVEVFTHIAMEVLDGLEPHHDQPDLLITGQLA